MAIWDTASTASLTGSTSARTILARLADYDPAGKPEIIGYRTAPSSAVKRELSGLARSRVNVVLNEGLNLNGGVLYVDGDLTVAKGVTGYGAVFATGKMKVTGGSDLGSDSRCALVAGGDLAISGAGADKTQFRGLVYSYGELAVSDVTIVGSLVGASAGGRPMTVERANLVYDPEGVVIDLDLQWSGVVEPYNTRGWITLNPASTLTPAFFVDENRDPTTAEILQMLLWNTPTGSRAPTLDDLRDLRKVKDVVDSIDAQAKALDASTASVKFHLDLNQFIKVQNAMKVLFRVP